MANTTISQLTPITGTAVANDDLFLVYDASANTEKYIAASEMKNMIGNGTLTINTSSANDALVVTSTDAGATAAPDIVFYRNSASPSASDLMGNIVFRGKNSLGANNDYATIGSIIASTTGGSESGAITFSTEFNGVLAERMRIQQSGSVGIGGTGSNAVSLFIQRNITGATTAFSVYSAPEVQSDVTGTAASFRSQLNVANTAFTTQFLVNYQAVQGTFGPLATVGTQFGFNCVGNLVGANTNIAFSSDASIASTVTTGKTVIGFRSAHPIATGGGTTWNFYANGTAPNYFQGNVSVGTITPDASKLYVSGNVAITSTLSAGGNITGGAQIAGKYTALANGTTAMALATNSVVKVTPTATATFTTTVAPAGSRASVIILTSGTTSYTITFGTGFITTGTLATGTVTAKTFVIDFVSDGTSMIETGRTTAM